MKNGRRVVWITGASSGIGEAAARKFAQRGDRLILSARRHGRLETVADELQTIDPGLDVLPLPVDVTDASQIERAGEEIARRYGHVDLVVACAGIGVMDLLERMPPGDVLGQIHANLDGAILVSRQVLPGMKERRSGHILLVASLASWIAMPGYSGYAASKFGVRGFAEALRREVRPWGIRVSTIYPGSVANGFGRKGETLRAVRVPRPSGFVLTSEEVGEALVRLADRPRRTIVLPARYLPAIWLNALFPGVVDAAAAAFFRSLRAGPTRADPPSPSR